MKSKEIYYGKLKGLMREKGITQTELADKIGMTVQALNAKLNGRSSFTVNEVNKICRVLSIENPTPYFFWDLNPKYATAIR